MPLPALFLNGTRVESGRRIIVSNLPISSGRDGEFADAEDAAARFRPQDVPLSTAAHLSARFTYVSPAGRLPDPAGGRVVDGGYFENSASATALEILYAVNAAIDRHHRDVELGRVQEWSEEPVPVIIEIRNGPTTEKPNNPETGDPSSDVETASPNPSLLARLFGEIGSPLRALLNARNARASFSQDTIEEEQRGMARQIREKKARASSPDTSNGGAGSSAPAPVSPRVAARTEATTEPGNFFRFGLRASPVPLPLGWMLSGAAAAEMQRQMEKKEANMDNVETCVKVLAALRPDWRGIAPE